MAAVPPPVGAPRRRRQRDNRLILALGLVLAPAALVVGVELLLRAAGLGNLPPAQASQLAYQQVYPPLLEPGSRPDGSPAWITNDARVPWQALDRPKTPGALRVVAVGGSATAGLGYSPNVSFPRELERLLRAAEPGRPIEVLNVGIVALSSSQVRWIVEDVCARGEPDVVLVYSGNNEFLEIHARKFAEAGPSSGGGVAALLADTNLFRLVGGLSRNAARGRSVTVDDMAVAQARVSETEIMTTVSLTAAEHDEILRTYEQNLRAMVDSAARHGSRLLLMTVASNWEWQGRHDLPETWIDELLGRKPGGETDLRAALQLVEQRLAAAPEHERHSWLFKQGLIQGRLGDWESSRNSLRAAMNADPRQRRATDAHAERVRRVATETGTPLLDVIEALRRRSPRGIVGNTHFYDYVHFTPEGCVRLAEEIFAALQPMGLVQPAPSFDSGTHSQARLAAFGALKSDPLGVGDWLGLGDLSRVHDRDLWKHQAHVRELDARLALQPDDVEALVARGNAAFFARDGWALAKELYERALAVQPGHSEAAANREILLSTRRP